ncbi:MAG: gliding motility protein GldN [Bacteroidota bacterium]|nr:gliding motility protein GldN [Bacteroidota bacterium]
MNKIIIAILICFIGVSTLSTAQKQKKEDENKYLDYTYEKKNVKERRVIPYPPLREADVVYSKKVERVIDTREKKNQPMAWPKNPFNKILYTLVTTSGDENKPGRIKAYRNDTFIKPLAVKDVKKVGGFCEIVDKQIDPNDPYRTEQVEVCSPFDYTQITRFRINEEWIFDKQRGMFFPRIISICPLYIPNIGGQTFPESPMFFVRYEDLRPIMIQEECFNRQNDGQQPTYYDWFESRMFSSYITKESNDKDMSINEMPEFKDNPMEALYESDRVKMELFNWEHDLWEY